MPVNVRGDGELGFHFSKSNLFRVIYVDGAFGGLSANGKMVQMSVYNERSPLPKLVVNSVKDGELGPEIVEKRVAKEGMFREVEASLVMSVEGAVAIRDWLTARITEAAEVVEVLADLKSRRPTNG